MEEHQITHTKKEQSIFSKNLQVLFFIVAAFIVGIYIGYNKHPWVDTVTGLENKQAAPNDVADFEPFWKVWNILNEKYPHAADVSNQERVWGAISGLVSSMNDPYTTFFPPEEAKQFNEEIIGSFSGIGVEIGMKDKLLTVISPLKNTPAYNAGLKPGDKILKIDDFVTSDTTIDQAIKMIRGEVGTPVVLTIYREGDNEPFEVKIIRDTINIPTVESTIKGDVYIINFYTFSANSYDLLHEELLNFKKSGLKNLVLDLRGNPGGFLDQAVDIASEFLPQGAPVVIEDYGTDQKQTILRSKGYGTIGQDVKTVLLVNGGSASASEILAGALSEDGRAIMIGEKTYGKGSVQELIPVTDTTSVKVTIAKWLTPNGISISEKGLIPQIVVEQKSGSKDDTQLLRALEYFKEGK